MPSGDATRAGDPRQFQREVGLRRENAEALRRELQQQGIPVDEIDRVIEQMRELESRPGFGDPRGLEALQTQVIEGLKSVEFSLYRKLGLGGDKSPTLGARAPVPPEYRAAVEEYYRSLAGAKPKP